jgi:hypothetical protein
MFATKKLTMQPNKKLLAAAVLLIATIGFSFKPNSNRSIHSKVDHYSIDQLPASWKENKSLIRAIDLILPSTVKELEQSVACVNCTTEYSVDILLDTPIIIKQTYHDISDKKRSEGFNYECVTEYAYKSSLAVYDTKKHGVSKVQITDPLTDEFTTTKKFNVVNKKGAPKQTVEEYIAANPLEVGPSQTDILAQTEKSIYKLKDAVQKLMKRRL